MLNLLVILSRGINRLNRAVGRATAWLTTGLVLLISYDVAARYLFQASSAAMFELEWHVFAVIFLVGAGDTLRRDRHVRVDVFYNRFTPRGRAWVDLLGTLLLLLPFCGLVLKASLPYVELSYRVAERSSDPGGLPYRFAIKSMILVGFGLLALQAIPLLTGSLLVLAGRDARALDVDARP
jgi:TRAP-type mannitol/chloroaromatic compound transport system permease small subunit